MYTFKSNIILFIMFVLSLSAYGQTCDLEMENFTGSSSANPPSGWIRGPGVNIGKVFGEPNEIAVGFNKEREYIISKPYTCAGQVCFEYRASGKSSNWDVDIYISQNVGLGSVWTNIGQITTNGSGSPTVFQQVCFDIPEATLFAPFNVSIKWEMTRRKSGTFYLDDVCVSSGICTVAPTKFVFTQVPNGCKIINTPFVVTVCATDDNGYIADTYQDNITLSSPQGGLSGTISENAVNGCFNATIMLDTEGTYTLNASSSDNSMQGVSSVIELMNSCPLVDTLKVMSYNLLNYPNGRDDCGANTVVPNRWDTLTNILQYVQPDILMVCELQNKLGSDMIDAVSLNFLGAPNYKKAEFVVNQSTAATAFNNMMFYNSDKVTLYSQEEVQTNTRDFNKYTVYGNDPGLATHGDTTFVDFYMAHLKAGGAVSDRARRAEDCVVLRDYLDARPERNNVLGGDLNFYTDQEAAYQTLTSGTFPFLDPAAMEGEWDGDFAYATVLTQSSREPGAANYDCGFGGGNDSRFDFLMTSKSILNETMHVSYIEDSYTPVGNNGSIFNRAINDPANTSGVPMDVLNSLYYMSDHLPVVMDLKLTYPSLSLPLTWGSIEASNSRNFNTVSWSSLSEINIDYFELEVRYQNDISFSVVDKVNAKGNSTIEIAYSIDDYNVEWTGNYYYRVKAVDFDGTFSYSNLVSTKVGSRDSKLKIFPNPVSNIVNLDYFTNGIEEVNVSLYDLSGKFLKQFIQTQQRKGLHHDSYSLAEFENGMYMMKVTIGSEVFIKKLIIGH